MSTPNKTRMAIASSSSQADAVRLRRRRQAQWILIGAGLIAASLISATAGALLAFSLSGTPLLQRNLTPEESSVFSQDDLVSGGFRIRLPRLTRSVNILVMGTSVLSSDVNNPPPETQNLGYHAQVDALNGLTDTILFVHFNPLKEELVVLSVPRDTRTFVPGLGMTKINAANVQGGPALTAQVVSELLGNVGIDRYVVMNVQGVEKLVDALGGVTVYVPQDMQYRDDSQRLYIDLKAGEQRLNGNQALQFLRFRYDNYGDIGRIQRQQILLRALAEQALNPRTIARLPDITNVVRSHIDTNLSMEELLALVGFASKSDRSQVEMLMLPGDFSTAEYDASYWLPKYEAIDTLVNNYLSSGNNGIIVNGNPANGENSPGLDANSIRITIQNSTGESGAGDRVADVLYDRGYSNLFLGEDRSENLQTTRIIAQTGNRDAAKAIHEILQIGEVRIESTGDLNSDITIQLGNDWLEP